MREKGYFENIYTDNDYLKPVYFDIQVLERYFEDPKYLIFYSDYRGSIVIDDKYIAERNETGEQGENTKVLYEAVEKYLNIRWEN